MVTNIALLAILLALSANVFANGFDENYEVRVGDYNSDGLQDFYVRQKPQVIILHGDIVTPIVLPAPVEDFVLTNNGNGTFSIAENLPITDKAMLLNWPESTVDVFTGDFNLDGLL